MLIMWVLLTRFLRELSGMRFFVGQRESRLLTGDFTLDAGENGKKTSWVSQA